MTADFQLYINGQFESGAATFESINPAQVKSGHTCRKLEPMKSTEQFRRHLGH